MTPKFIEVTVFRNDSKVMVNPRRLDFFRENPRPTQQPERSKKFGVKGAFGNIFLTRHQREQKRIVREAAKALPAS